MDCDKGCTLRRCAGIAVMAAIGIAVLGWVVMLLWNWLLPALFVGVSPLGYGQALGLLLLCKILFGGFHGRGHRRSKGRRQGNESLSEEEKARLKGVFARRWSCGCAPDRDDTAGAPKGAEQ